MTYQPDFSGVWAKLDRAKEHRDAFQSEAGFIGGISSAEPVGNRIPVSAEFDDESGYNVFRAAATLPEDVLRRWGLILGDAIHNLRGALDHLTWQLAWFGRKGRKPRDPHKVQFPIKDEPLPSDAPPENFARLDARGNHGPLRDVCPEHRAIIEGYQPYKGWNGSTDLTRHPFFRLREFSNRDKHRVVTPVLLVPAKVSLAFAQTTTVLDVVTVGFGKALKAGAEVVRMSTDPPRLGFVSPSVMPPSAKPHMDVAGYLTPLITFPYLGKPGMRGQEVQFVTSQAPIALDEMAALVTHVVREFEPLF